jgi:broad specificity phosphatase PhoE
MSDFLLIRHGETDLAGTFCGHSNPSLNERGRQQVAALINALAEQRIESVYSSDLLRAQETARPLGAAKGASLCSLAGLREINFGAWEGLRWNEVEASNRQYAERWLTEYPSLGAPEGETVDAFEARVVATIEPLLRMDMGPIAVVSHAGVMRVILRRFGGFTEEQCFASSKEYCSVVRLARCAGEGLSDYCKELHGESQWTMHAEESPGVVTNCVTFSDRR